MHERAALLPEWAVAELRRPLATSDALRERVMDRVRAVRPTCAATAHLAPSESAWRGAIVAGAPAPSPSRRKRSLSAMGATLALAASIVGMVAMPALLRSRGEAAAPLEGTTGGRMIVLGDTVDSALHDTLRLVRFVLDAPAAARVALAGDFNEWSSTTTPLTDSAGSGVWSVVVALDRTDRRYAFVVDDTQWVGAASSADHAASSAPPRTAPVGGDST